MISSICQKAPTAYSMCHLSKLRYIAPLALLFSVCHSSYAGPIELQQAKRMHERLTGEQPSLAVLQAMEAELNLGTAAGGEAAARIAMESDSFYRVTLKNWVAPWTNRDSEVFVPLNDYIATVMGYVKDDKDFRGILSDNVMYVVSGVTPASVPDNNDHYIAAEATDPSNFSLKDALTETTQTAIPAAATAGVMTSRAAAEAFFVDGTNRAMLRYTLVNHLCNDMEQLQDASLPPDRVRQDVSRSPGGDSRVYSNTCVTCHGGLDPMAQAFAYYDYDNDGIVNEQGDEIAAATNRIVYNDSGDVDIDEKTGEPSNQADPNQPNLQRVQRKYHINGTTFPAGYVTPDDQWSNYWRTGVNQFLGWGSGSGTGNGAKSLGEELANSNAFAQCQVKKVFQAVCLRDPINTDDTAQLASMASSFTSGGHLKQTFAEAAYYCRER